MPPVAHTLGDLLDATARARPDADAVIFRDRRLTYAMLQAQADDLARALFGMGVRKGDRVAILLPNRPEWLVAAFAIGKLGAITVGVSTFSAPREVAWTLEHCRPAAIITMEAFRGRSYLEPLYALCPELAASTPGELRSERLPELRAVISVDERCHDGVSRFTDVLVRASSSTRRARRPRRRASSSPTGA
jgi:fatty-acyl-CoA synthase